MFYRDSDGLDPTTKEHVHLCGDGVFVRKLTFHPRSLKLTYSSCLLHAWRPLEGIWSARREGFTITIRLRLNRTCSITPLQAHRISQAGWDVARRIWVSSCGDCCVWQLEEDGRGLDWHGKTSPWKAASSEAPGGQPAEPILETASGLGQKEWGLWLTQAWDWWFTRQIQLHNPPYDSQLYETNNPSFINKSSIHPLKKHISSETSNNSWVNYVNYCFWQITVHHYRFQIQYVDPFSTVWSLIFGTLNTAWWQQCNGMTNLFWHHCLLNYTFTHLTERNST